MTKTVVLLLSLLLGSPAFAADAVADLTAKYLEGLFRAKPHLATFMGDHRFDGALPDLSTAGRKRREEELVAQRKALDAIDLKPLAIDAQVDAEILRDGIDLELVYLRDIRDWEWDPRLYDSFPYYDPREIVAGRLSDIIHGDFAPEADRRASVITQLRALPQFLMQMKIALKRPPKEYLEQASKGNKGRIEFFESEVKPFVGTSGEAKLGIDGALTALKQYQEFLDKELVLRSDGDWRLGKERYSKKFPLALQTKLTPDEVLPRAEAAFKKTRLELYEVARRLHKTLFPKEAQPPKGPVYPEHEAQVISRVKNALAADHPKAAELVEAHGKNLDRMRAFIEKHSLVGLPKKETLRVEAMPAFKRGSSAAEYLAPGVLIRNPDWHATYYVDPIDPTWPAERVESYLRGQNNYEVELVAMHEAYPGHHTQYFYSKRNLNPLRAVMWNAAMVEGWAVYGEGLMVDAGWPSSKRDALNDRYRFFDLRGRMIVATNTILDIKLQTGQMTDEQAVKFMVEEGYQEKAMAEKKLLRAKLDSTQLVQYFLGLDEILGLEADYRKKVGKKYAQRAFDEALIEHGSIAVKHLRRYLLGEAR